MVESTANNCHYESVTKKIWMPLHREIQGVLLYMVCRANYGFQWVHSALFVYIVNTYFLLGKNRWLFKKFLTDQWELQKEHEVVFSCFNAYFIRIKVKS